MISGLHCLLTDGRDVDLNALAKVQVILRQCDSRDAIIYCATSGDVTSLKKYLEQNPGEVQMISLSTSL